MPELADILIYPATVMSIALCLSPIPTIQEVYRSQSVSGYSPIPYAITAGQSALWWAYAKQINKPAMIPVNAIQVTVELVYCGIFLFFGKNQRKSLVALLSGLSFAVVGLYLLDYYMASKPGNVLFYFTIILNILMFASPLATIREVIRTQNAKVMPLPLSLATFLCGLLWFFYGLAENVIACVIPNGIGVLLGGFQLFIIYKFRQLPNKTDVHAPQSPLKPMFTSV